MSFAPAAEVAADQHGALTLDQMHHSGLSSARIRTLVGRGILEQRGHRVFVVAGSPNTWRRRVLVACLSVGPLAAASHRTAAALWQLDHWRPGVIELLVPRGKWHPVDGVQVHEANCLPGEHLAAIDGIPTTSAARTVVDMARFANMARLGAIADDAARRKLVSYRELLLVHLELPRRGRRRSRRAGAMLAYRPDGAGVSGSPLEDLVYELIVDAGIPAPSRQVRVDGFDHVLVVDMAWPELRVAVECDGYAYHGSPTARSRDDSRRNMMQADGWNVLAVTWTMAKESPEQVIEQVARLLFRRSVSAASDSRLSRSRDAGETVE